MREALMQSTALASALIGYAPIIDAKRMAIATRVSVVPDPNADIPVSYVQLYQDLARQWPAHAGSMLLDVGGMSLGGEMLETTPMRQIWIEIPAEITAGHDGQELITELHRAGYTMVLRGRPPAPLPKHLLPAFKMSIIHLAEDRRINEPTPVPSGGFVRTIPFAQAGVSTIDMMERCFARGAYAAIGWPMDDALQRADRRQANPDIATITQLLAMVDRGDDVVHMEALIRRDAALAYRLLRYINSPGMGLQVEVQSFRHAVMMLGYSKLKRWLALLLSTASKDANMRPVMFASFRRGVFLEHLVAAGADDHLRDEIFILGVFSLLDKLLKEPFPQLFDRLHVPERVRETLVDKNGPYAPYLRIAETIEQGPNPALVDQLGDCVLSLEQCNEALMRALTAPDLATA